MNKEEQIASIKQRILDEHRKHKNIDWAEIAARKIYSTHLVKEKCNLPVVRRIAFPNGKKKLPKGKYKNGYSYELPNGDIVHQSFIPKYKWSAYHDTEKKAAIAVDKFLIGKGKEPINVLVRR